MTVEVSRPILMARGLNLDHRRVRVLADIDIDVYPAEIHFVVGVVGSGKSALVEVLSGSWPASSGTMVVDGVEQPPFPDLKVARAAGIVSIPQNLALVPALGAADNIFLGSTAAAYGRSASSRGMSSGDQLEDRVHAVLEQLGDTFDVAVPVEDLSRIRRILVAFARAIVSRPRVVILDEVIDGLSEADANRVLQIVRELRDRGISIVLVTSQIERALSLADRVSVVRRGRVRWTKRSEEVDESQLLDAVLGLDDRAVFPARSRALGTGSSKDSVGKVEGAVEARAVLELKDVSTNELSNIYMKVSPGRILGVFGNRGAGQSELLKVMAGIIQPLLGEVLLNGTPVSRASKHEIAYMRPTASKLPPPGVLATLKHFAEDLNELGERLFAFAKNDSFVPPPRSRMAAQAADDPVAVHARREEIEKLLQHKPHLLLLDDPAGGGDGTSKSEVYRAIRTLADSGVAVVVTSDDLPELHSLSDELVVLRRGKLIGLVDPLSSSLQATLDMAKGKRG